MALETAAVDTVTTDTVPRAAADRRSEPASPGDSRPPAVVLDNVTKVYGHAGAATPALDRVSLEVKAGELVCLVGASGCGKSTLLNLVSGLDQPSAGRVSRPAGAATLMFQDSALFPWLTVERNIELALRLAKVPRPDRRGRIDELLAMVRLEGFSDKRPHELSGGMRQRVALARALAQQRPILLMDEPFGALDAITRDVLHDELERVWAETGLTILFVTHNVAEAVRLGDRVVVLSSRPGRVARIFEVDAARPRRIDTAEAAATAGAVTDALRQEVARHG